MIVILHSKNALSQWQVKYMCFREKFKMGYTKIICKILTELM